MTSVATFELSKPTPGTKVPEGTLGFVKSKLRNDLYNLIVAAFRRSGLTQAELALRLGKRPEIISRNLGAPGNYTIDTVAEMLFAINGNFVAASENDALSKSKDFDMPAWLTSISDDMDLDAKKSAAIINLRDYKSSISGTQRNGNKFSVNK